MRFSTAVVIASQVALAAACSVQCKPGCVLERTYVDRVRHTTTDCWYRGQQVDLPLSLTSCDEPAGSPLLFGDCTPCAAGGEQSGRATCLRRGFCGRAWRVQEPQFNCNCNPVRNCESDAQCPVGEWCRTRKSGEENCAAEKECVPLAAEGEACGGLQLPCLVGRCPADMACKGEQLAPGACERVETCPERPQCGFGFVETEECARDDFFFGRCKKETLCGKTIACRPTLVMG